MVADHYGLTGIKRETVIASIAVGGVTLGWFAGSVIVNLAKSLLKSNSVIKFTNTTAAHMLEASRYVAYKYTK